MNGIKNNMRKIRRWRDISQNDLAEQLLLTQDYISRIENSYYCPSVVTALQLAKALDVTVEELFELEEK